MTRKRLLGKVKHNLGDRAFDPEIVELAVDTTLQYLLDYSQDLSEQLMSKHLHSEAMSAGTVITKLKALLSGD